MILKPADAPASTVRGLLTLFLTSPAVGTSPYARETLQEACDLLAQTMGDKLPSHFRETVEATLESSNDRFFLALKPAKEGGVDWWDLPLPPNLSDLLSFLDEQGQTEPDVIVCEMGGPDHFIEIHSKEHS